MPSRFRAVPTRLQREAGHAPNNTAGGPITMLLRRAVLPLLGPGCALALLLVVYRPVLFLGEQFAFRDAAHYYYPLYLRVQQEWQSGRWPLWDPWQNAGQPLLAS